VRQEFKAKTKAVAFQRAKGCCEECGAKLGPGNVEYDHDTPCALGGDNSLENCVVRCKTCHKLKTGTQDIPHIAKAKRRERKHIGIRSRPSRPLPGTRASGVRKRMNGSVERWPE
jgi:5-methylcytosine-specific restriction enzyme A